MRVTEQQAQNINQKDRLIPGKKIVVFVMDLLCMIPYYDSYLCAALRKILPETRLAAINFHLDPRYFATQGVRRQGGIVDLIANLSIRSRRFRQTLKLLEYLVNMMLLSFRFMVKRPDIVHVQWIPLVGRIPVELWFLRLLQWRGAKLVYTVHNVLPHDSDDRHRSVFRGVYGIMDLLVCHTRLSQQQLINEFAIPSGKTTVIQHGPLFKDTVRVDGKDARKRLGISQDLTVILFFGTIRPYKGIEFILESWKILAETTENAVLLIAGSGEAGYLETVTGCIDRMGIGKTVIPHFRYISSEDLPLFFEASDILVYPYKDITQSGALLTGMTFGKPIVATAVGGIGETLRHGENALLVEYGNCNQLAAGLATLIANPHERQRLGTAARAGQERTHSWQEIAQQTANCYRELLSR
jgi:glycosyltransferase involved in cell wall biosynthesis